MRFDVAGPFSEAGSISQYAALDGKLIFEELYWKESEGKVFEGHHSA